MIRLMAATDGIGRRWHAVDVWGNGKIDMALEFVVFPRKSKDVLFYETANIALSQFPTTQGDVGKSTEMY